MTSDNSRYTNWQQLGEGGEAQVFRVWDAESLRWMAIRECRGSVAARARSSADSLFLLNHPGLVKLHAFGDSQGRFRMVMDYAHGVPVDSLVPMDPRLALELVIDLCHTLEYLHCHGFVHGDLHPSNLQVTDGLRCVVTDLGSIAPLGNSPSHTLGALHYLSPEHCLGFPVQKASDIFGCGLLLYKLLTGSDLFHSRNFTEHSLALQELAVDQGMQAIRQRLLFLPLPCMDLVFRCLRFRPEDRCEDMDELAERSEMALAQLIALPDQIPLHQVRSSLSLRIPAHLSPPATFPDSASIDCIPISPPRRQWPWLFAVTGVALAIALGASLAKHKTNPSTLARLGNDLLEDARQETLSTNAEDSLRTVTIPHASRFAEFEIDSTPYPGGTEFLRLSLGQHVFRGRLQNADRWLSAGVVVSDSTTPLWNWSRKP